MSAGLGRRQLSFSVVELQRLQSYTAPLKITVEHSQKVKNISAILQIYSTPQHMLRRFRVLPTYRYSAILTDAMFAIVKEWKQQKCLSPREFQVVKMWYVYIAQYYSAVKK